MFKKNSCDGVYHNSLDVRFTKACDNSCSFCIEHTGIDALKQDISSMINSTIESGCDTILILGGEPFINPRKLWEYVGGIRDYVEEIYITTSLPNTINLSDIFVKQILEEVNGINVSIQHHDWVINNTILHARSKHNRIEQLQKISEKFGHKIRVNLNLVNGQLDSKEKITEALMLLSSFGVNEIKLNELQNVSKTEYISYENIMGIKMASPYAFGCQTDISSQWKTIPSKILLKRACFHVQPQESKRAGFFDFVKIVLEKYVFKKSNVTQIVMYENGDLSRGWRTK